MKIKLLFFLVFLLVIHAIPVFSIEVGGHITENITWIPENNPYHVVENIFVDSGVTLTIAPGTIIEIGSAKMEHQGDYINFELYNEESVAKMLWINGRIIAEGTEEDSIIFTRDQDIEYYRWGTILLSENSEEMSCFKHCKIEFTYEIFNANGWYIYEGAICADNGKLELENSLIQNVMGNGITFEEIVHTVLIKNNTFKTIVEPPYPLHFVEYIVINIPYGNPTSIPLIADNYFYGKVGVWALGCPVNFVENKCYGEGKYVDMDINEEDFGIPAYIYGNKLFEFDSGYSNAPIYIRDSGTDTVYVKNNVLSGKGCGIYSTESNVEISQNVLDSCYINTDSNSEGSVFNNIVQNSNLNRGGITGGKADVTNNIVKNCKIGCSFWASREKVVKNNIFIGNEYAFNNLRSDDSIIENNIITENDNIVDYDYDMDAFFRNNILDFELPEGCIDGGGNLWQDPMFVDAENGDYHLLPGSPCIDAGFDTLASYYPVFDMDFNQRIWNGDDDDTTRIDIGVYEYGSNYLGGISGHVFKYEGDDEPLPYVLLKINNINSKHEFADSAGFYHFNIKPGTYDIYATRLFYDEVIIEDVEVTAGETTIIDFAMEEDPTYAKDIHPGTESLPKNIILYNYPNPFNPSTTIAFQIPDVESQHVVTLRLYDVSGKLVKTLIDEPMKPGHYSANWHGDDDDGKQVSSGIYFYRLETEKISETKRMILLK